MPALNDMCLPGNISYLNIKRRRRRVKFKNQEDEYEHRYALP